MWAIVLNSQFGCILRFNYALKHNAMKTLFYWSIVLLVPVFGAHAQVLDQSNVFPEIGEYSYDFVSSEIVPWTTVDTVGTDVIWDVTDFEWMTDASFSYVVEDAAESPFIDMVPGANRYIREDYETASLHRYFRVDANALSELAGVIEIPDSDPMDYPSCPELMLNLPAEFGDLTVPSLDNCDLFGQGYIERRVLATGQLITPAGVFGDVVLVRQTIAVEDVIGEKGEFGLVWTNNYQWFAQGNLIYPLLTVSYNSTSQFFQGAYMQLPDISNGIAELGSEALEIYPNPSSDRLVVTHRGGQPFGAARIVSPQGVLVRELPRANTTRLEVEIGDLSPGVYMIQTETGGSRRFLKL